jgi:EmrB/QacA subfamily drug resistance transporter
MAAPQVELRVGTSQGRWAIAASVLGSGAVFVEGTVVNVALPSIGRDLGLGVSGIQWVASGYLITLSALLLLGGALGDAFGQRPSLEVGLVLFALGSALTAVAPSFPLLVAARLFQGAAGALLVPTSLALLDTSFVPADRNVAIGQWAAWSAVSTGLGPLLGGGLVDLASWRWVFAAIVPLPLVGAWIAHTRLPRAPRPPARPVDVRGAALVSAGIGLVVWSLIEGPRRGGTPVVLAAGAVGLALCVGFLFVEARAPDPLLPLSLFRSRQFSGANTATLLTYVAVGALFFFLMLQLQNNLDYTALDAGASLLPINALMLLLSAPAGRWSERWGPRVPISIGALLEAVGLALFARVDAGSGYWSRVLPATLIFGLGLAVLVAPLTASVLAAAERGRTGVASAVNNAVARLAGLLAVTVLPLAAGIGGAEQLAGPALSAVFSRVMWMSAGLCAGGAALSWATIRRRVPVPPQTHPSPLQGCAHRSFRGQPG